MSLQNEPSEVRKRIILDYKKAVIKTARVGQASTFIYRNEALENYFRNSNGAGFSIRKLDIEEIKTIDDDYKKTRLKITIDTPKREIYLSIDQAFLVHGKWKIATGYKLEAK